MAFGYLLSAEFYKIKSINLFNIKYLFKLDKFDIYIATGVYYTFEKF